MGKPPQNISNSPFSDRLPKGSGTYFRITYLSQLNLSQQADHKAHLMLWINMGVLSFLISKHHGVLWKTERLWNANILLVVICVIGTMLAILASRPMLPKRPAEERPNWLFFGSFAVFPYKQFHENLENLMQDEAALQEAMSRDLFLMGKALARKYRYLSYCYLVFGIGWGVVVLAYVYFGFFH